jgi:hypothetical protein
MLSARMASLRPSNTLKRLQEEKDEEDIITHSENFDSSSEPPEPKLKKK